MDSLAKRIVSLIWMFICYFLFTVINIGSDVALSHNLISKSQNPNTNETRNGSLQQNLHNTTFVFGLVVLAPAALSCVFNVLKWFCLETSTTSCGTTSIPTKVFTWVFSPFYAIYLVFKVLYKAMRGYASWKDDKEILEGEVGYHESGVQSMLQVIILGICAFNALYSWVLRVFMKIGLKTEIT